MLSPVELEKLPSLPLKNSNDIPDGTYTIASPKEKIVTASGPEIETDIWFKTRPLDINLIQRIYSLQLVAESHDQGFCGDPLAGNWTWFEIAILENGTSRHPRVKDGIELVWTSHANRFLTSDFDWVAGNEFDDIHDMFRLLEDGDVISVRLCARFNSWKICARKGYLIFTIGEPIARDPLQYGQTKETVMSIQEVFQEVNNSIFPESMQISTPDKELLFRAEMLTSAGDKPLRVLSLDGGGVRGIAALKILEAVMNKAAPGKKPCEVFDMIGGTSTGGFIAIMLGRMQMTVQQCLQKYELFMDRVFPKGKIPKTIFTGSKWDPRALEKVIKELVKETIGGNPDEVLLFDEKTAQTCKVFVMATRRTGSNNQAPVVFRSYESPLDKPVLPGIKLWEAARATSAAPSYFPPLKTGGMEFLDGGLQANNPLGWLWNEVLSVYGPARATNCFLSIGTGIPAAKTVHDVRWVPSFAGDMAGIATNTEIMNLLFRSLINAFAPQPMGKKYWRFSVGDGLPDWVEEEKGVWRWKLRGVRIEEDIGELDDVKAIDRTNKKAKEYIENPEAKKLIHECADALKKNI